VPQQLYELPLAADKRREDPDSVALDASGRSYGPTYRRSGRKAAVAAVATGGAAALAEALDVESSSVQVLTSILTSGLVVEAGEIMNW
jgi:hypothetical protein